MVAPLVSSDRQLVWFGEYALDLRSGELSRNGDRCLLPEQPFRILTVLLRHPGTLVTREDLRRELWRDDTFVDFEHSLNAAVKRLREALGDSATTPRFVETLPRRGYRFIGEIEAPRTAEPAEALAPAPARPRRGVARLAWIGAALLTIAAVLLASRPPERQKASPSLIRLTSTAGLNADPAFSPDGRLLAFASDRAGGGKFDIWVQPVGGGEPLQVTSEPSDDVEPSFSPDGSEIVFSRRDTGVYVIGALGGLPRLIANARWARTPRFSPDGRWIAYWTGFLATAVGDDAATISIVPAAGGTPRILRPPPIASARYPVWSPDGSRILFLGQENREQQVFDWYLVNRDGSGLLKTDAVERISAAGLGAGPPVASAWTASRNAVVFSTSEGGASSLGEIAISPEDGRASGTPRRLTFGTGIERSPAVAASGRIAFSSVVENIDIWRVPLDPHTGVASGPLERVTDSPASDRLLTVSGNGKTMLFISSRSNADEVWVRDLTTGRERQVTHGGAVDATLSHDGSRLAYSTMESGRRSVWIVNIDGGPRSLLCADCSIPDDWAPDGKHLLLEKEVQSRLAIYDVSTGQEKELTAHPTWNLHRAHFSPDSQWVAFHTTTNSPNVRQIYVTRADRLTAPAEWVRVISDHGCHASWSRDGSFLYHFSNRDGAFCPWVQRIDPATKQPLGPPRAVLHLHNPRLRAAAGAAASNDVQAGYLYLTATEATGNIWMLDDTHD